jgi:hypothetical protein
VGYESKLVCFSGELMKARFKIARVRASRGYSSVGSREMLLAKDATRE